MVPAGRRLLAVPVRARARRVAADRTVLAVAAVVVVAAVTTEFGNS